MNKIAAQASQGQGMNYPQQTSNNRATSPSNNGVDLSGILRNALQQAVDQNNTRTYQQPAAQAPAQPPAQAPSPVPAILAQIQQLQQQQQQRQAQEANNDPLAQVRSMLMSALNQRQAQQQPAPPRVEARPETPQQILLQALARLQQGQSNNAGNQVPVNFPQPIYDNSACTNNAHGGGAAFQPQYQQQAAPPVIDDSLIERLQGAVNLVRSIQQQQQARNDLPTEISTTVKAPVLEEPKEVKVSAIPEMHTVKSQRESLHLVQDCKNSRDASETLTTLGSTLRSKSDPYVDAAVIPDPDIGLGSKNRDSSTLFPDKLYKMLQKVREQGQEHIVSFLPHGRAFKVHKMDRFIAEILPVHFHGQKRWCSFIRQCQLYGFIRVTTGQDAGAYYHELFLDGHPNLCRYMKRVGAPKGLDRRRYKLPSGSDPDFYRMKSLGTVVYDSDMSDMSRGSGDPIISSSASASL